MAPQKTGSHTEIEKPPYDASPANLETICTELLGGPARASDLLEDDTVSLSKQPINRNIGYGVRLGFLTESEDGYEVTSSGETLAHVGAANAEWLFEKAVKNDPLYRSLITKVVESNGVTVVQNSDCVTRESVLDTLTSEYDFGLGERSLKAAAATYLRTLDAAGFGTYVRGDGEYPTRLELDESIFGTFLLDRRSELAVREGKEEENEENETDENEADEEAVHEAAHVASDEAVNASLSTRPVQVNIHVDVGAYEEGDDTAENVVQLVRDLEDEFKSEGSRG